MVATHCCQSLVNSHLMINNLEIIMLGVYHIENIGGIHYQHAV